MCRAATEKSSLYLGGWASLSGTAFYMACCDHNLSMDLPAAVLFNDTLSALKQVLKEFVLSIEVELSKLKSLT